MNENDLPEHAMPDAQTIVEAVNFVNRVNFLFDRWEVDKLVSVFTGDVIVDHPLGRSVGRPALAEFLKAYEPITHGVRRHNCNHVVAYGGDGDVVVSYYILLIRIAPSADAPRLKVEPMRIMEYDAHFPKLISYAMVTDTLTKLEDGQWRVRHKRVENVAEDTVHHF
jgi:hypothetical protein